MITTETARGAAVQGLRVAWPTALVVVGASVLAAPWHHWWVTLIFALTAALPLLLLRGALRLGMSRWVATALLVLLSVMGAYLLTSRAEMSLGETVRDVVPRLLTAPTPYATSADLLAGPLLATALVSLLVGLRLEGRHRVEALVGAVLLYLGGVLLTGGDADPWGLAAALLLALAVAGWVLLDDHAEPLRPRVATAAPLGVVGVGVLAAVATLPVANGYSPRELVEPPTYQVTASNPLTQLGAWATNPSVELLRVRGDDVPLRLVVLDDYDGTQWYSATRFETVRTTGETGLRLDRYAVGSQVQVAFAGLGGNWLPSPGTPLDIGMTDALLDDGTGTLYHRGDTDELTYEVTGGYDEPPEAALLRAQVPTRGFERYTELPPLSPGLAEYAGAIVADAGTPYARAAAIEQQLRRAYQFSPSAPSGSALYRLEAFLLGDPDDPSVTGARQGTSEQFASSFAVLARFNGLPTRVVVGFGPGQDVGEGTRSVRGEDALAWAEVYFEGLGWVAFSPTPDDETFTPRQPVSPPPSPPDQPESEGPPPSEPPSSEAPAPSSDSPPDAAAPAPVASPPAWRPYAVAGAGLAGLAVLLLVLRGLRRLWHRRRGAAGAWAEVLDALRLTGWRPAPHQPADLAAAEADARLGTTAAVPVAGLAEQAAFGPPAGPPSADPGADRRTHLRAVRRAARHLLPWYRRWWYHLDPRVFAPR